MTIKVLPMELPANEHFAAEVVVGTRESVLGANVEIIRIKLWTHGKVVLYSYHGEKNGKWVDDDTILIIMKIDIPIREGNSIIIEFVI